jgi:predicted ATP-grasp superfamily ATP-dependent carboligase
VSKRIAIVGASVRAAAASAVRAGYQVAATDLFADEDLAAIADCTRIDDYPQGFVGWLRSLSPRPDAWFCTDALENHPDLVDELAAIAPLWGNGGDTLRRVRSPQSLSETLRAAGWRFPAISFETMDA